VFWDVSAAVEFLFSVIYLRNLGHYELKFDPLAGFSRRHASGSLHSLTEGAAYAE